jgi:alkylated DNA repair dioxygenase AlkB
MPYLDDYKTVPGLAAYIRRGQAVLAEEEGITPFLLHPRLPDEEIISTYFSAHPDQIKNLDERIGKEVFPRIFMLPGERLYEEYGQKYAAGLFEVWGKGLAEHAVNMVAYVPGLLGIHGPRKWAQEQSRELHSSPSMQAYAAWREDEPVTWDNFMHMDIALRGLGEMLPSVTIMAASYFGALGASSKIAGLSGLSPQAAAFTTMAILEGSGEYIEAMDILVNEMGIDEDEAWKTAAPASIAYGMAAGYLETTPFFHFLKKWSPDAEKHLLGGLVRKFVKGRFTLPMSRRAASAIDMSILEASTEWSQGTLQNIINKEILLGYATSNEEAFTRLWQEFSDDQEIWEQTYAGAVGGLAFGLIGGVGAKRGEARARRRARREIVEEAAEAPIEVPLQTGVIQTGERKGESVDIVGETKSGKSWVIQFADGGVTNKLKTSVLMEEPTVAAAAPAAVTSREYLESLIIGRPPVIIEEPPAGEEYDLQRHIRSTQDYSSFEERQLDFFKYTEDTSIIDRLSEEDRDVLLGNIGKFFEEREVVKGEITDERTRSLIDMYAKGDISLKEKAERITPEEVLIEKVVTPTTAEAETFLEQAMMESEIAAQVEAAGYTPGSEGFAEELATRVGSVSDEEAIQDIWRESVIAGVGQLTGVPTKTESKVEDLKVESVSDEEVSKAGKGYSKGDIVRVKHVKGKPISKLSGRNYQIVSRGNNSATIADIQTGKLHQHIPYDLIYRVKAEAPSEKNISKMYANDLNKILNSSGIVESAAEGSVEKEIYESLPKTGKGKVSFSGADKKIVAKAVSDFVNRRKPTTEAPPSEASIRQKEEFNKKVPAMSVARLKDILKEHGIEKADKLNKAQLVKKVQALPPAPTVEEIFDFGEEAPAVAPPAKAVTAKDVHDAAIKANLEPDSKEFMDMSKEVVDERHIDNMSNDQRKRLIDFIKQEEAPAVEAPAVIPDDVTKSGIEIYKKFITQPDKIYQNFKYIILNTGRKSFGWFSAWYGPIDYTYTGITHKTQEMPKEFSDLARQIEEATGVESGYYNSALVNLFPKGKGISAHADDENIFVRENNTIGKVATVSLGGSTQITISGATDDVITVDAGDVYVMPGQEFQLKHKHAVGPSNRERISLTFRHIPKIRLAVEPEPVEVKKPERTKREEKGDALTKDEVASIVNDIIKKKEGGEYSVEIEVGKAKRYTIEGNRKSYKKIVKRITDKMPFIKPFGENFETDIVDRRLVLHDESTGTEYIINLPEADPSTGKRVLGRAWGTLVEWSKTGNLDTPPHEFFHVYFNLREGSPENKLAVKIFEAAAYKWTKNVRKIKKELTPHEAVGEYLAYHVGKYYVERLTGSLANRIGSWIKVFWSKLKAMFAKSKLTSQDIFNIIASGFYSKKKVEPTSSELDDFNISTHKDKTNAEYDVEDEDGSEDDYNVWESLSDPDISSIKRLELTTRTIFGKNLLSKELVNILMKAREIEVRRDPTKSFSEAHNEFRDYVINANFVDELDIIRREEFLKGASEIAGEGRSVIGLKRRDLNNLRFLYQFASSTMPREGKIELWVEKDRHGGITSIKRLPPDIDPITGKAQSKFVNMSFIDDLPGNVGAKTILLKFSNIVRGLWSWKDNDGVSHTNYIPAAVEQTVDRNAFLDKRLGAMDIALIGPKGLDKSAFLMTFVTEEDKKEGKSLDEYLSREVNSKNISVEDKDAFLAYAKENEEYNPNINSQIVAKHKWWKAVFGDKYLIWQRETVTTTEDMLNRTRIALSEGIIVRGLGEVSTFIVDPDKVRIEIPSRKVKGEINSYELGEKWDGGMYWSSELSYRIQDKLGKKPLRGEFSLSEVKPAIWHKTDNGLLAMKMNWFFPRPGTRLVDKETGEEVLRVIGEPGDIRIVLPDGTLVDTFATTLETKKMWGDFEGKTNEVINIPEKSIRIIQTTDQKGKDTVAFPFGAVDLMLSNDLQADKEFVKGYDVATKEMFRRANSVISLLINGRAHPQNFKRLLEDIGILKDVVSTIEEEALKETHDFAIFHPHFMQRFESSIFNYALKSAAFRGRVKGKGTYIALAPDFENEIDDGEIGFGDKNMEVLKNAQKRVFTDEEHEEFRILLRDRATRPQAMEMLSAALEKNDIYVIRTRNPITDIAAFGIKKVSDIVAGAGNVAMLSNNDVFAVIQGDFDGDHLSIDFITAEEAKAYLAMQNSKAYKARQKPVVMSWFEHPAGVGLLSDLNAVHEIGERVSLAQYAQGVMTNLKAVREVLAYKKISIKGEDVAGKSVVYSVVNPYDEVIMDYAPLDVSNKDLKKKERQAIYDEIIEAKGQVVDVNENNVKFDDISTENKYFLKTNSAHEVSILTQAAVDNPKEFLLYHWKYNGYPFLWSRVIKRDDGQRMDISFPETSEVANDDYIRDVWHWMGQVFKYSAARRGRDRKLRPLLPEEVVGFSEDIMGMAEASEEELKNYVVKRMKVAAWLQKKSDKAFVHQLQNDHKVDKINIKNNITPTEKIFAMYAEIYEETIDDEATPTDDGVVTRIPKDLRDHAHHLGIRLLTKNLPNVFKKAGVKIVSREENIKAAKDGIKWADRVGSDFLNIFADQQYKDKRGKVHKKGAGFSYRANYSDALSAFIVDNLDSFRNLSKPAQMYASWYYLRGISKVDYRVKSAVKTISKVEALLPMELMDKDVFIEYLDSWGMAVQDEDAVASIVVEKEIEDEGVTVARVFNKVQEEIC